MIGFGQHARWRPKALAKGLLAPLRRHPALFRLLRRFGIRRRAIWQHLYFEGEMEVEVAPEIVVKMIAYGYEVENELFWGGFDHGHEATTLAVWRALARDARAVADVGANTGIFALSAKALNPAATVLAVEPIARIHAKLLRNIALNGRPIHATPAAASGASGTATIYDLAAEHSYSASLDPSMLGDAATVRMEVQVETLDALAAEAGIERLDLVKIDVERHEVEVLAGMKQTLQSRPAIVIEILDPDLGAKVEQLIAPYDYRTYAILEGIGLERVSALGRHQRNYLLCDPEVLNRLRAAGIAVSEAGSA